MQKCGKCGKQFDNVKGKCPTCGWESLDNPHDGKGLVDDPLSANDVVDLIDALEGEVNNGGFHQFFYNSTGNRTGETIQALEVVGAFAMADIVKRAAQMFPFGIPPKSRFERQDVLLEAYPNGAAFRLLDEEFYRYPDDLAALVNRFKSSA